MNRAVRHFASIALALLSLAAAHPAAATVLSFGFDFGTDPLPDSALNNSGINYGNRVAATSQNDFEYGSAGGFTPNVVVTYGTNPTGSAFHGATTGFGDLQRVVFGTSPTNDFISELTLTADAGFRVQLSSFDVGGSPLQDRVALVSILDEASAILFSQIGAAIEGDAGHSTFTFGTPLEGAAIKIRLQSVNPGAANSVLGFDNILYSQVAVPEPTAAALVLPALIASALRRRRA